jgi:hypothetical protein
MKHPGKIECDLCHNEIPRGVKHAGIVIPLSKDDRDMFIKEIQRDMPKMEHNIFGGMMTAERMAPAYWSFEVCVSCIDGILPMLRELKTEQIQNILRERELARERGRQQDEEQEVQP